MTNSEVVTSGKWQTVDSSAGVIQHHDSAGQKICLSHACNRGDCVCQPIHIDVGDPKVQEGWAGRSADSENGAEVLVKADHDCPAPPRLGDNLLIGCSGIHDLGDANNRVPLRPEPLDHMARNVDVCQESHAAGGSSNARPEASHAAYRRHSPMSSSSSSGNSSTISVEVLPSARYFKTSDTGIRRPRTQGCPWQTVGSSVIRLVDVSMPLRLLQLSVRGKHLGCPSTVPSKSCRPDRWAGLPR